MQRCGNGDQERESELAEVTQLKVAALSLTIRAASFPMHQTGRGDREAEREELFPWGIFNSKSLAKAKNIKRS